MKKIPIRTYNGSATIVDKRDLSLKYWSDSKNMNPKNSYCQTDFRGSTDESDSIGNSDPGDVIFFGPVDLVNDPHKNQLVDGKLVPDYSYSSERFNLTIRATDSVVRLSLVSQSNVTTIISLDVSTAAVEVFQDDTHVKLLFDTESYWLGKISRIYYPTDDPFAVAKDGIYAARLTESFGKNELGLRLLSDGSLGLRENKTLGINFDISTEPESELDRVVTYLYQGDRSTGGFDVQVEVWLLNDEDDNPIASFNTNILANDPTFGNNLTANEHWAFKGYDTDKIYFQKEYFDEHNIFKTDSAGNEETHEFPLVTNPTIEVGTSGWTSITGEFYEVPDYGTMTEYTWGYAGSNIGGEEGIGFDNAHTKVQFAGTLILDNKDEFVSFYKEMPLNIEEDRFGFKIENITIPSDVNDRVTGFGIYLRFHDTEDFQQVKSVNLLSEDKSFDPLIIHSLSPNGIFLSQTIGILFDINTHRRIPYYTQYEKARGVPYVLAENNVFKAPTGNGQLLDIRYPEDVLPNITTDRIIDIQALNEKLGVISNTNTVAIEIELSNAIAFYIPKQFMDFGVKNKLDVAKTPDAVILNTIKGIYATNGREKILLSGEINDIVETYYDTTMIYYNRIDKELYLISPEWEGIVYIFSFEFKSWRPVDLRNKLAIERIYDDDDGNIYIKTANGLQKISKIATGTGYMEYSSDYGEISGWKALLNVVVDFVGKVSYNGEEVEHTVRDAHKFTVPIASRYLSRAIDIRIDVINNTTIYNTELFVDEVYEEDF